jgi:hypothetical protein
MAIWKRRAALTALIAASLLTPLAAGAYKMKMVSGIVGGQDDESKKLLALSPAEAEQAGRRDLLSVLQANPKFKLDNSRNVEGMTFVTQPYQTWHRYVCREDRVTLRYQNESQVNAAGGYLGTPREAVGVEAQPVYHIAQLPVPSFLQEPSSYPSTICDERHPGPAATWFAAPSDIDAIRAANMFRMAEDEMKAGRLKPGPCDPHGTDTCRQWILSLDDPSKIESVELCAPSTIGDDACYVISFGSDSVELTVRGTILSNNSEPITPTAITSIRADAVGRMTL